MNHLGDNFVDKHRKRALLAGYFLPSGMIRVKNIGGKRSQVRVAGKTVLIQPILGNWKNYREYLEPLYKILDDHAEE